MATASWNSCEGTLRVLSSVRLVQFIYRQLWRCRVAFIGVATAYLQRTLTATPIRRGHSGAALYETCVAGQKNLDVYQFWHPLV